MSGALAGIGFLIIGASQFAHNGYLISTLHSDLQQQGASVATFGACATMPDAYLSPRIVSCGTAVRVGPGPVTEDKSKTARSWAVADLIRQYHPQVVVIGIADTLADYRQHEMSVPWVRQQVHALAEKIAAEHVACIWLGTTWGTEGGPLGKNFARVKELSAVLAESVAPCEYVDSLAFSAPGEWPTIDGQHHTAAGYELWGAAATKAILDTEAVKHLQAADKGATP